jgi:hypothetical protein
MVIAVDNHYQLRVQVPLTIPLTILPVPQPRIMLYHIFASHWWQSLEHFHTKTPSVKVSDNCGFRYTFHKISLYSQPFESTWSFQLSMKLMHLIPFQWSIAGLDIAKTTRTYQLCQGKLYLFHSFGFQQLKHMVPYYFNPFHIDSWNIKVPKTITLDDENRRRFTRMHTIFLYNFSKYASCDSPNTLFLLSRWISILMIERHSSRISFWSLRTRTSSSFTIDWHYCYHARCQSHMHD